MKAEDIEGEEETYVRGDQQCKEEEIPTHISTDGPNNRDTPERCPRPLYSQDCTEENHRIPQEDTDKHLSEIKVEVKDEEELYVTNIKIEDIEGEDTYGTDMKAEDIEGEDETYVTDMKAEDTEVEDEMYVTDMNGEEIYVTKIKAEDIEGEEEMYMRGDQQCKEEEIPTDINTAHGCKSGNIWTENLILSPRCEIEHNDLKQDSLGGTSMGPVLHEVPHSAYVSPVPAYNEDCSPSTSITALICPECGKYFPRKSHLDRHQRSHTAMSIEFTDHDFWTGFIELYRSHECLWRVKSKKYFNREKKLKAYQELIDYSKGRNSQADIQWVKKRIQNFRTVFYKEHKRVIKSQRSGAGSDEVRRPSLWYYNLLMFTLEQEPRTESVCSAMPKSPEGVLEEEVGSEELLSPLTTEGNPPIAEHSEMEVIEIEPVPPQPSQPPNRRRRVGPRTSSSGEARTHQFLNRAEEILQRPPDAQMIFGMNIACEMQSLEPTQRQRFKTILYDALVCAQNGQLPECLLLPSHTLR
ncbi:uncharacterized protein LOC135057004 isoform X1 [Pseudophryne corroboree]|uniref:uncharacterized protein LOC135057004 isoform X1 n=1 Tax=Pseudophryne corroboree TaxID=495146 RepID=UPI003081B5BC